MTLQQYIEWFDEVTDPTERLIGLVPPDRIGWKLTEDSFSLGQLIGHLGISLRFNGTVLAGEEPPLKSMRAILVANRRQSEASVETALEEFRIAKDRFRGIMNRGGEEWFQKGKVDTPQFGRRSVWRFAVFVLEHHIHHLMELHLCLKVLGVRVHTGTLYTTPREHT